MARLRTLFRNNVVLQYLAALAACVIAGRIVGFAPVAFATISLWLLPGLTLAIRPNLIKQPERQWRPMLSVFALFPVGLAAILSMGIPRRLLPAFAGLTLLAVSTGVIGGLRVRARARREEGEPA